MNNQIIYQFIGAAISVAALACPADAVEPKKALPYVASAFVSGSGSWLTNDTFGPADTINSQIQSLLIGGSFLLPITEAWNVQFSGVWRRDKQSWEEQTDSDYPSLITNQFQGGVAAFWRDTSIGLLGVDAGFFSPSDSGSLRYIKVGGLAEFYVSDFLTIGLLGGLLEPIDAGPHEVRSSEALSPFFRPGSYVGGYATWYPSDNLSVSAFGQYLEARTNFSFADEDSDIGEIKTTNLIAGGTLSYLTNLDGLSLFVSGDFSRCDTSGNGDIQGSSINGIALMGGINLHIGSVNSSLLEMDRTGVVNTPVWGCNGRFSISSNP